MEYIVFAIVRWRNYLNIILKQTFFLFAYIFFTTSQLCQLLSRDFRCMADYSCLFEMSRHKC